MISQPVLFSLPLFGPIDPTAPTWIQVNLGRNAECSRHQLVITSTPDPPTAGTVKVRAIQRKSGLAPAHFDSRLDSVNMTSGSQIFVFYGFFDFLRFDFASFPAGTKLSAHLYSHLDSLLISGNAP